jgi:hypothetical protein
MISVGIHNAWWVFIKLCHSNDFEQSIIVGSLIQQFEVNSLIQVLLNAVKKQKSLAIVQGFF